MTPPQKLLLLEDDSSDIELLKKRLAQDWPGWQLVITSTETGFREALAANRFDLIISDYALTGFHGLEALSIARQRCPEVPFIFLSGMLGDDVAVEALKAGATD